MKATLMFGAGDVRIADVPEPTIKHPTDAIVRTVRACVCGSDLHPYHDMPRNDAGNPMGHELIAVVEEVGSDVTTVRPGDFVIVPFAYQDNTCVYCQEGMQTSCIHGGFYGQPDPGGLQAQYARIPLADGSMVKVPDINPDTASDELLASLLTLSDVYLTGYHAAHMGEVTPGKIVTVIGDGAVGLSAVLAAKSLGAERIILMGRHKDRTDLGREFGATDVVAERGEEGVAEVKELTDGYGAHGVVEAVGNQVSMDQAIASCRPGGHVGYVGVAHDVTLDGSSLFFAEVTLLGGPAPVRRFLPDLIDRILKREIHPGRVFTMRLPLEEAAEGYAAMDERRAIKVLLEV